MTKNSRIKKDKVFLKENGYARIKNTRSYNYHGNWETATMVYTCKKNKETFEQVIMPKENEFDYIWDNQIKPELKGYDVLHKKQDVNSSGVLYNLVTKKDNQTVIVYIAYDVANNVVSKKETVINGEPYV